MMHTEKKVVYKGDLTEENLRLDARQEHTGSCAEVIVPWLHIFCSVFLASGKVRTASECQDPCRADCQTLRWRRAMPGGGGSSPMHAHLLVSKMPGLLVASCGNCARHHWAEPISSSTYY